MKTQKYIVTIKMPDGNRISSEWLKDLIESDCCIEEEDEGRFSISVEEISTSEDFEEEIKKYEASLPESATVDPFEGYPTLKDIALHFYILGLKNNIPVTQITLDELAKEGESVSEDLEVRKQIEELANDWHHKGFASNEDCPLCMQDLMDILWHFYELGKQSKEPVSEDLEKAAESFAWEKEQPLADGERLSYTFKPRIEAFIAGAEWQKEQMPKWKKNGGLLRFAILEDENGRYVQHEGYKIYFNDLLKLPKED